MVQTVRGKVKSCVWIAFVVFIAGWFVGGCASYNVQTQKISQSYELGNILAAAAQISAEADKHGEGKDAVVWRLEQGAILRAAGKLEESDKAFDKAEELVNKYEQQAKVKLGREALASVTNLTSLPYEGFAYDKIMMNTYKALNYLQLGDYEKARVELNRAMERQRDAVQINLARIEKEQEKGEKQNLHVDLDKVNGDSKFQNQFNSNYADLNQHRAYADYVNPLTVYLDGLYFMTQSTGSSDFERSRKSFERVRDMIGENKFIQQDLDILKQVEMGQPIPPTTYVFFETGLAPEREQIRIDLPLFLITPGVPYVGAAFPKLKYHDNYLSLLNVSYSGTTESATLLASMDSVVAREFKNEMPIVITKTLIASAIKAGATYGAYAGVTNGGRKDSGAGLAVLIAGAIYQVAMNQADLRTWTTLPKEFQFCRLPTPADGEIELSVPFSGGKMPVTIEGGAVNVVWVKSVNRGSPLLVSQFKLKDETKGIVTSPPPPETAAPKEVPQQEPPKPEQLNQVTQPNGSTPEQSTQKNQTETSSEQPTQPLQPESSKSEQLTQGTPTETSNSERTSQESKPEQTTQTDNNRPSIKQVE